MRKLHKTQILELLKTLDRAIDSTKNLLLNRQTATLTNLLADCQDGATDASDFIKEIYGENTKALQLLAEFSDMLYKTSVEINENKTDNNFAEYLKKQLAAIETCVKDELKPNKIEAVFLPYKASMWDSLESIYLSAKNDPACDAFVVPIPYYEKKDNKFTEMHWETGYPKNIPLSDYRKYNIEERRPDIIFMHNPYDNSNTLTSVHPDFYSSRLRDLTDCLVYVPYFVGNRNKMDLPEINCTFAACIYAHKIIAQTEAERKTYIRVYTEFAKKNSSIVPERFDKAESKFLALGSPKLDKVINTKREDCEIPAEWEKLISSTDGIRKKVVFYNTSIGPLLQYSVDENKISNMPLQKIRKVFEFFKKQRNAVLLWRPHPLLENTIKSMRPWLEQEYAEIVTEYKTGNYGIFDSSEDLSRAIALSDMYYGDVSSVTNLFAAAEKPIIWKTLGIPAFAGLYCDGFNIWFINCFNMLFKYARQSKKTEYMGKLPLRDWAFRGIAENNKKLYFASGYDDGLFVFDTVQKKIEKNCEFNYEIQFAISFKNFVYLVPAQFSAILRLNTDTGEKTWFSEWTKEILAFNCYCIVENEIALIVRDANSILFFNMESGEYVIEKFETGSENIIYYNSICSCGQNYYFSPFCENYIAKWNRKTKKFLKIKFPDSFSRKENKSDANFSVRYSNKHIWLFPYSAYNAYKINVDTDKITELPELVEHFVDHLWTWRYNQVLVDEDFIYASTENKGVVEYNVNTRELNFIKPPESDIEQKLLYNLSNYEFPEEWEKLATGANGVRKKIVFYNTGINALLPYSIENNKPSNKYLQKIKGVFEFFKNQHDFVLLWRPHPFLENAIKNMRPWLEPEYAELVNEYKTQGYGIYCDSENLDRAVALSDVFYGDGSIITALFNVMAKPVYGQSFEITQLTGFCNDGDFIWFMNGSNMLYKYNKQSKETEYMGFIPKQKSWGYAGISKNNNKLYFAPFLGDTISVFDIDKKIFERADFNDDSKIERKFNKVADYKHFLYFFPSEFPAILRFNTNTKETEHFTQWVEELSKLQLSKPQEIWKNTIFFSYCVVDTEIAIIINGANAVMFFDMETCNYEIRNVGEKSEQYNQLCFDGQNYYLTPLYKDYIVKWNRQSNEISKIKMPSFSRKENIYVNFAIRFLNEHVWLIPHAANNAYKINVNTNEITELPELVRHFEDKSLIWHYNIAFTSGDSIYAATQKKGIVEYCINTRELNFVKPVFGIDPWLFSYINDTLPEKGNSGKKIWEHFRGLLCQE